MRWQNFADTLVFFCPLLIILPYSYFQYHTKSKIFPNCLASSPLQASFHGKSLAAMGFFLERVENCFLSDVRRSLWGIRFPVH